MKRVIKARANKNMLLLFAIWLGVKKLRLNRILIDAALVVAKNNLLFVY